MTFSIVAANGESAGVAVASKFLAVGAVVPAARAGVGAIATQSYANLAYRADGLRLLADGHGAQQTLATLTDADPQREQRQAGVVDARGQAATFTGAECHPWAGGLTVAPDAGGLAAAIQGNILAGPQVVEAMQRAWLDSANQPLPRRLLAALAAGDRTGGDRRGRQSAALLVASPGGGYAGGSDIAVDLRVDDHPDPIGELTRLLDLHDLYFGRPDPAAALPLSGRLADEVRRRLADLGYAAGDLAAALADWAGVENLEERLLAGRIDPLVLDVLRERSA